MLLHEAGAPDERHLRVRFALGTPLVEEGALEPGSLVEEGALEPGSLVEEGALEPGSLVEEGALAPVTRPLEMRFVDQRMFGGLIVSTGGADLPTEIAHIARDPIDPEFDDSEFVRRARRRTSAIKRLLLDQGLISGVGNIYADEALWRSRLHGERPGDRLTGPVLRDLLGHVREVMGEALAQGGTSFDALYVNVNGESGYFDRSLDAYGREGEPCRRCGTPIRRVGFMNRSSFFCPRCQRPPRSR
jgi:formamidopyrimidine-DNA glycosylase